MKMSSSDYNFLKSGSI